MADLMMELCDAIGPEERGLVKCQACRGFGCVQGGCPEAPDLEQCDKCAGQGYVAALPSLSPQGDQTK